MLLQTGSDLLLPSRQRLVIPQTIEECHAFIKQWMDALLTPEETSDFTKYSVSTLATWRSRESQPLPYIKLGNGSIRYRRWDILEWANSRLVKPMA
jgi:predicted DNA-binding transcriptional regulator AlpA